MLSLRELRLHHKVLLVGRRRMKLNELLILYTLIGVLRLRHVNGRCWVLVHLRLLLLEAAELILICVHVTWHALLTESLIRRCSHWHGLHHSLVLLLGGEWNKICRKLPIVLAQTLLKHWLLWEFLDINFLTVIHGASRTIQHNFVHVLAQIHALVLHGHLARAQVVYKQLWVIWIRVGIVLYKWLLLLLLRVGSCRLIVLHWKNTARWLNLIVGSFDSSLKLKKALFTRVI